MTCVYVLRLLPARNRLRPPPTADAPLHSLSPARSRKAHSDPDLLSLSAMFGRSPFAPRAGLLNNAEIVVWQSSRRLSIALAIGVIGIVLRVTGVVTGPLWPILAVVPS